MGKGQQFERDFARKLSLWWTEGERDDVFWRSPASGGLATVRSKAKKTVVKSTVGDIVAVHPSGESLLDIVFFELKKGYGYIRLTDLFLFQSSKIYQWLASCNVKRVEHDLEFILVTSHRTQKLMFLSHNLTQKLDKIIGFHVNSVVFRSASLGFFGVIDYEVFFRHVSPVAFMEAVNED